MRLSSARALGLALFMAGLFPTALQAAAPAASDTASLANVDTALLDAARSQGKADFVIQLRTKADLSAAAQARTRTEKGRIVVSALKAAAARSQAGVIAQLQARGLSYQPHWIANAIVGRGSVLDIEALARLSEVDALTLISTQPTAPSGRYREQPRAAGKTTAKRSLAKAGGVEPSIALVHAPEVWALGFKGQGIVVGDHDIGVEWEHPALKGKYRGWNAATETATHDYNWLNAFGPIDPFCTDTAVPCDSNGHGTHTTGTMVGDDGAGNQIGMAPDAQWMACRSLLDPVLGVGTVPTYLTCMEWTLAPYPTSGDTSAADPAMAPDVVNNSWGCLEGCAPPLLQDVNEAIEAAGIIQVVSAGNDGDTCNTILFPLAVYDSSFTVGATDNSDVMASFSSRGAVVSDLSMRIKPNVVAPGVDTYSAWLDGEYNSISGTSMAGPHVAGLVALILSAEPRLIGRVREVRTLIEATAVPIVSGETCSGTSDADIPNNTWGYGRIDALAAVQGRPQLTLSASAPASATTGANFEYKAVVTEAAGARIPVSNAVLTVTLPSGVTLVSSSETASGSGALSFTHAALAPGESWTVSLQLKSDTAGARAVSSGVESDQVSPKAGNTTSTNVGGSGSGGGGSSGGGGGAMGGITLISLLALAATRRRRR